MDYVKITLKLEIEFCLLLNYNLNYKPNYMYRIYLEMEK